MKSGPFTEIKIQSLYPFQCEGPVTWNADIPENDTKRIPIWANINEAL